jgi:hypothetical protein
VAVGPESVVVAIAATVAPAATTSVPRGVTVASDPADSSAGIGPVLLVAIVAAALVWWNWTVTTDSPVSPDDGVKPAPTKPSPPTKPRKP